MAKRGENIITLGIMRKLGVTLADECQVQRKLMPHERKQKIKKHGVPRKIEIAMSLQKMGYPGTFKEIWMRLKQAEIWAQKHPNPETCGFTVKKKKLIAPAKKSGFTRKPMYQYRNLID